MFRRDHLRAATAAMCSDPEWHKNVSVKANFIAHRPGELGARRIAATSSTDIWLKGFMRPIDPRSPADWNRLYHEMRTETTQGCDVRAECASGTIPIAISYKWYHKKPGRRMTDVQFHNLRNTVLHHFGRKEGAKVSFWLDQHMGKFEFVSDEQKKKWLDYGSTAYCHSIVCYLPNVKITVPINEKGDATLHFNQPQDISATFRADTSRIWIAFEIRRATQGIGLMCGASTDLGVCKNVVMDGPKTTMDMWENGFQVGGLLNNEDAKLFEYADILSGRLQNINDDWDETYLIPEQARLAREPPMLVSRIKRYRHMTEGGTYQFSGRGEYENDAGLPRISVCDIGPGQHATSSHIAIRKVKPEDRWNRGAILIVGDFDVEEKAVEVAKVPVRLIASDRFEFLDLWVTHVSTKNAEKYCCIVTRSGRIIEIIDVWPVNSHLYDAAVQGVDKGAAAVLAHLGDLEVTSQDWADYIPKRAALWSEVYKAPDFPYGR